MIVWGQTHIKSGLASILNGTTPIFSVILAHFLTKEERLTTNRMSGVLIGWVGVAVLIGFNSLRGFGIEVYGQIALLGAALSYACAAIYGRRFKGVSPLVVATGMECICWHGTDIYWLDCQRWTIVRKVQTQGRCLVL